MKELDNYEQKILNKMNKELPTIIQLIEELKQRLEFELNHVLISSTEQKERLKQLLFACNIYLEQL